MFNLLSEYKSLKDLIKQTRDTFIIQLDAFFNEELFPYNQDLTETTLIKGKMMDALDQKGDIKEILNNTQTLNYLQFLQVNFSHCMDTNKAALNLVKRQKISEELEKYFNIEQSQEQLQQQISIIGEKLEKQNIIQLPHDCKQYEERFNPQQMTITQILSLNNQEYVSGGWDGQLIYFNGQEILRQIQLFSNPVRSLELMKDKLILAIDDNNCYAILDKKLNSIVEGQLQTDQSVIAIEIVNNKVNMKLENGDLLVSNILSGLKEQTILKNNLSDGQRILTYKENTQIAIDQFDQIGGIIINTMDENNTIIGKYLFQISEYQIEQALIYDENTNYLIDSHHQLFKNDQLLKLKACKLFQQGFLINEDQEVYFKEELILKTGIQNVHQIHYDGKQLIIVGSGIEVYWIKE